jgi:hypothetical protein
MRHYSLINEELVETTGYPTHIPLSQLDGVADIPSEELVKRVERRHLSVLRSLFPGLR